MFAGHIGAEGSKPLLQTHRVEGFATSRDDAEFLTGFPQHVPQSRTEIGRGVDLPAEFADIGQAHRRDRHSPEHRRLGAEVLESGVAEVLVGDLGDDVPGQWSPQSDAAGSRRGLAHGHPFRRVGGRLMPGRPRDGGEVDVRVRSHLVGLLVEDRDRDVARDAASLIEQQRVADRSGFAQHRRGGHPVQQFAGTGAGDLETLELGHVEHRHRGARLPRFGCGDGRVELIRPGVPFRCRPLGRHLRQQCGVRVEPVRALPAGGFEEERTELLLLPAERARAQVAGGDPWLQGVDDVVDLDEVLLRGFADVVR